MNKARAFTLIELLVVISIIALLSSVVLASLNSAREKARIAGAQQFAGQASRVIGASAAGIWDFEGVSGASIEDRSGNGNAGTVVGTASYVSGPVSASTAIGLFGDAYVQVANADSLDMGTADFTVMAWVRTTGYLAHGSVWNMLVAKGDCCTAPSFAIGYDNTNVPRLMVNSISSTVAGPAINDDQWHHVAGVRKGNTATTYVDGRETGSITAAGIGATVGNSSAFYIGKDSNGIIRTIRGYVDNVVYVSSALTASEVGDAYAAGAQERGLAIE